MKKTNRRNLKTVLLPLLLACVCIFMAACQPTPLQAVVIGKSENAMTQAAAPPPGQESDTPGYQIPQSFTMQLDKGTLTVSADAPVSMPQEQSIPVVRARPAAYTQEEIDRIKDYFFGDALMTDGSMWYTKGQLEEAILEFKEELAQVEAGEDGADADSLRMYIAEFEEKLKTAPETAEAMAYPQLRRDYEKGEQFDTLEATADLGGASPSTFSVTNWYDDDYGPVMRHVIVNLFTFYGVNGIGEQAEGLETTPAQAALKALDVMADLGFENMSVDFVARGYAQDVAGSDESKQGYYVRLHPSVNGVIVKHSSYPQNEQDMRPALSADWVSITLDDSGVTTFSWMDKIEQVETVTENVQLLPFDEIQTIFGQQIAAQYAWVNEYEQTDEKGNVTQSPPYPIRIDRVELEYACIPEKDSPDTCLLVPVWAFYEDPPFENQTEYALTGMGDDLPVCHLAINAVDGSTLAF